VRARQAEERKSARMNQQEREREREGKRKGRKTRNRERENREGDIEKRGSPRRSQARY